MLTTTLILELLASGVLLVFSAFFSGTEIALFSLSKLPLRPKATKSMSYLIVALPPIWHNTHRC
jgi:CBS domain containing-hemolysin-like protein